MEIISENVNPPTKRPEGGDFCIFSWNLLHSSHVDASRMYPQCTGDELDQNFRLERLIGNLKVILSENTKTITTIDVFLFQEIDEESFLKLNQLVFQPFGFKGAFKKRTDQNLDGLASFFNENKYDLLDAHAIEFDKSKMNQQWNWLNKGNVALLFVLEQKTTNNNINNKNSNEEIMKTNRFVVSNCHIHWSPRRGDIKLAQIKILLDGVDFLKQKYSDEQHTCATILGGDFNLTPHSDLFEFITSGRLDRLENRSVENCSGQLIHEMRFSGGNFRPSPHKSLANNVSQFNSRKNQSAKTHHNKHKTFSNQKNVSLEHSLLDLRSAYSQTELSRSYSTCHACFIGVVDYIFYSTTLLECTEIKYVLPINPKSPLPYSKQQNAWSTQRLQNQNRNVNHLFLPNKQNPCSDHLPLCVEFKFK